MVASKGKSEVPVVLKFAFSGVANIGATLFTHPLDVIKVRMQLSGEGMYFFAALIICFVVVFIAGNFGFFPTSLWKWASCVWRADFPVLSQSLT